MSGDKISCGHYPQGMLRRGFACCLLLCLGVVGGLLLPRFWSTPPALPAPEILAPRVEPPAEIVPPGVPPTPDPTDLLFNSLEVLSIEIEVPREGAAALRDWHWRSGEAPRPEARATVREGGRVYTDVAVQLKGAAGSFRPFDDEPGLTLKFDQHETAQRFHGLRKLSLNNSIQDASLLSEKICRELFLAAGVPAPRAAHAFVKLNGRDLGLYVLVEGFNRQFLKRHFGNTSGNLFDSGFVQDVSDPLSVNSGDQPEDRSPLDRLIEAASEPDEKLRLEKLAAVLDVERFLAFLAMEAIVCHWDGYAMNRNNYRVFHDLDSGRAVFLPHGLDQVFGGGRGSTSQSILPQARGQIAAAILETTPGRERYLETVKRLVDKVFVVERILDRIDEIAAPIHAAFGEQLEGRAESFSRRVEWFKSAIEERGRSIESQLENSAELSFSQDQVVLRPDDWQPRTTLGEPTVVEEEVAEGRACLVIRAGSEPCAASWWTRVELPPGRYRFEGRVRCREILGRGDEEDGAWVSLKVDGVSEGRKLHGTRGWTILSQRFRVRRGEWASALDLACELRSHSGEAWFDKQSLRVIRE